MDPQTAGTQALGTAELPRGPPLPSAREAPRSSEVSAAADTVTHYGRVGKLWSPRSRGSVWSSLGASWLTQRTVRGRAWSGNLRAAGRRGCGAGHPEGWSGSSCRGRKAAGPWGRLCVLAQWEVMLMAESRGPLRGS